MNRFFRPFLLIVLIAQALSGCVTAFDAKAPDDFATLTAGANGSTYVRAVSPTGVVYRVRSEAQEPKAELSFWKETLARRLTDEGYRVTATKDVMVAGVPGAAIEAVAPFADRDYAILVAIAPVGDRIVIVEGAGEQAAWEKAEPMMLKAAAEVASK